MLSTIEEFIPERAYSIDPFDRAGYGSVYPDGNYAGTDPSNALL